jgi:nitroreductase
MLLAIHAYGLGSCWTFIKDFDDPDVEKKVKKLLNIPADIEVICILPIGYPDQKPEKRELKKQKDIVHKENW